MGNSSVEDTYFPRNNYLRIRDKLIDFSSPKIMGIVNVTPDSFYQKSRHNEEKELLETVNEMLRDGADWIDLGGFSTRPHADFITVEEEIKRIHPYLKAIRKEFPELIISLDTFRSKVAQMGIEEGIDIINDISGLQYDENMLELVSKHKTAYILMHAPETFDRMHEIIENADVLKDVCQFLSKQLQLLKQKGVHDVIIDPGFGFGKTIEQNHQLLQQLELLSILEHPILVGFSRKSMITKKLGIEASEALNGTTILNTTAILKGASILRVHDVKEAKQIISLLV